jgi:hypothetical protein
VVEARRSSDVLKAPFSLTVGALGATVSPDPDVIAQLAVGTPTNRPYMVTNTGGAFAGRATGGVLGSARLDTPTIDAGDQSQFPVSVTPGTSQLRATIGSPNDPAADLDLFVYSCVTGTCALAGQSANSGSEESVTIEDPAPGAWVVLVDGFDVPDGSTTYDYVDSLTNPAYGSITVDDADAQRAPGASWQVTGTITADTAPPSGRVLLGHVQVRTSTDELVGTNDVIVQEVE